MLLLAIGRAGQSPEADLVARYAKRLRPALRVIELPDGRGSPAEIKRHEATTLLAALPAKSFLIMLDQDGETLDSIGLSLRLTAWQSTSRPLAFMIGGAEGLDASVRSRADAALSLGKLTWPHLLARVMVVEQLYRAQADRKSVV